MHEITIQINKYIYIYIYIYIYHALKPTPRAWWSFHISSPKVGNDTNIHLVTKISNYQIPIQSSTKKILKSSNINFKTNISNKVLLSKQIQTYTIAKSNQILTFKQSLKIKFKQTS